MLRMRIFDTIIGNWDRGPRNYMVDDDWNIVLIDHSQAFASSLPKRLVRGRHLRNDQGVTP